MSTIKIVSRWDSRDAYLRGAALLDKRASDNEAIANLDKVRAIVLDDADRLEMGHWHAENSERRTKTCAEEPGGTTHLAGWLQVCSTDPEIRAVDEWLAGALQAPVAAKMFFRGADEVRGWLRDRKYVSEIEEANKRAEERNARRGWGSRRTL